MAWDKETELRLRQVIKDSGVALLAISLAWVGFAILPFFNKIEYNYQRYNKYVPGKHGNGVRVFLLYREDRSFEKNYGEKNFQYFVDKFRNRENAEYFLPQNHPLSIA